MTDMPIGAGRADSPARKKTTTPAKRAGRSDAETPIPTGDVARFGDMVLFGLRILQSLGRMRPYLSESLRQATIIANGSTLIILVVMFLLGSGLGQEAAAVARALGAAPAAATFGAIGSTESLPTFIFGYVLAAKVGCGMVAELGAMRVREEIDAIEVLGTPSFLFLVVTRFLGAMLVVPFIYIISIGASNFGSILNALYRYGDVSPGTFIYTFFNAIDPMTLLRSFIHGMVMSVGIIVVALYYGWKARGGPVEVGMATARSMAVNIVFSTLTMTVYIFFVDPRPLLSIA